MCILRVEIPDGSYTLVPTDKDEGAGGDVQYVTIEQDPDQTMEGCVFACADEGKPPVYSLTYVFLQASGFYQCYFMCIYVQELI
jgi:hypothetical protein